MPSDCQVGLSHDCEEGLNRQVNLELKTSYLYLAMAQYLNSEKVALPGFAKFFENASTEEREHAIKVSRVSTCGFDDFAFMRCSSHQGSYAVSPRFSTK